MDRYDKGESFGGVIDEIIEEQRHKTDLFRTIRDIEAEGNLDTVKPELREWYEKEKKYN